MIFQVCVFTKASITNVTFKGPRTIVNVHMRFEITRRRKRFRTQITLMGFFLQQIKYNILVIQHKL